MNLKDEDISLKLLSSSAVTLSRFSSYWWLHHPNGLQKLFINNVGISDCKIQISSSRLWKK